MKTDYIKSELYIKLYHHMQYENALALRVALETGMRIGDVLSLKPCDLDGRTISYTAQKTGKKGKAVISADLSKRLCQIASKNFIFAGRFGNKPRCRQTVWKDVKKASKELKFLENVAPHSARKTFAVDDFHENGLPHTQKQLQHDRTDTTMLYAFSDLLTGKASKTVDVELLAEMIAEKVVEKLRQTAF